MIRQKRFSQARSLWQTALALDPENSKYQKAITLVPKLRKLSRCLPYLEWAVLVGFCIYILILLYSITPAKITALPVVKFDNLQAILSATSISDRSSEIAFVTPEKSSLNGSTQAMVITSTEESKAGATIDLQEDIAISTAKEEDLLQITAESLIEEPDEISTKTHVIQFGESLSALARQYFKDSGKYYLFVNANKDRYPSLIDNPHNIRPGWVLVIPNIAIEE
jgi:nucleoid-associated protein YgaU